MSGHCHLFFLYLNSIRAELQEESKSGSEQAKVAGEMWQSLSSEEKALFIEEATRKRKTISCEVPEKAIRKET